MNQTESNPKFEALLKRMAAVGCSWSDLAKETGHTARHLKSAAASPEPSQKIIISIEHALQHPIWSSAEKFARAQYVRELFTGKHPDQISMKMLRNIARNHKIDISNLKSRAALVQKLLPILSTVEATQKRISEVGPLEFLKEKVAELRAEASPDLNPEESPPKWPHVVPQSQSRSKRSTMRRTNCAEPPGKSAP